MKGRDRPLMKKLNLLNIHFYARLSYIVSLCYFRAYERNIIRDGGNQHPHYIKWFGCGSFWDTR